LPFLLLAAVPAVRNFNPRIAGCLIAFEAPMTECEAYKTLALRVAN
jgi:hypothetical protein